MTWRRVVAAAVLGFIAGVVIGMALTILDLMERVTVLEILVRAL